MVDDDNFSSSKKLLRDDERSESVGGPSSSLGERRVQSKRGEIEYQLERSKKVRSDVSRSSRR